MKKFVTVDRLYLAKYIMMSAIENYNASNLYPGNQWCEYNLYRRARAYDRVRQAALLIAKGVYNRKQCVALLGSMTRVSTDPVSERGKRKDFLFVEEHLRSFPYLHDVFCSEVNMLSET